MASQSVHYAYDRFDARPDITFGRLIDVADRSQSIQNGRQSAIASEWIAELARKVVIFLAVVFKMKDERLEQLWQARTIFPISLGDLIGLLRVALEY